MLWPKPLDLRLERGFDRPIRRLNGDHAQSGIGNKASLADASGYIINAGGGIPMHDFAIA